MHLKGKVRLKRSLGLFEMTTYGIGIIVGAGIYALIGQGAATAGNALWLSFFVGAVIAALTALSYAELGSMFPRDAAEYIYSKKAFDSKSISFVVGWLTIFVQIVAASTVSLGFGGYLYNLTGINPVVAALSLVIVLSFINFLGIKESAAVTIITTMIEMAGLIIVIIIGSRFFGSVNYFEMPQGLSGVLTAAIIMFFAYLGFEEIVNVSEEIKNPRKVIPKAIFLSVSISTVIYMLVSIAAVSTISWQKLGQFQAPLTEIAAIGLPQSSLIMSIIALFSTGSTALIMLLATSRKIFGMTEEHSALPSFLSALHPKRRTPHFAITIALLISIGLIMIGNIKTVAELTNFGAFAVFFTVNLSLIWLRYREPNAKRPFKVPFNIGNFPVTAALGSAITLYMLKFFEPQIALFTVLLILGGFFFFIFLTRK